MEVARCFLGSLDCTYAKSARGMPSAGRSAPVLGAAEAGPTGMKCARTTSPEVVIMTRSTGC